MKVDTTIKNNIIEIINGISKEIPKIKNQTILITGGAGFLGKNIVWTLQELNRNHNTNCNIIVVDNNEEKIKNWNGSLGSLPVYEPGLAEIIEKVRGKNLFFSNDIQGAIEKSEMIFMAVNTPTKKEGEGAGMAADLRYVEN